MWAKAVKQGWGLHEHSVACKRCSQPDVMTAVLMTVVVAEAY